MTDNKIDKVDKDVLDKDVLSRLYISFLQDFSNWSNLHGKYFSQLVTIIISFLGVSLGLFYYFKSIGLDARVIGILPLFNFGFSCVAIFICNGYYMRAVESVIISNKLFYLLKKSIGDIDEILKNDSKKPFSTDEYLYPKRWIDVAKDFCSSEDFQRDRIKKGANLWLIFFLSLLAAVNLIIAIIIFFKIV